MNPCNAVQMVITQKCGQQLTDVVKDTGGFKKRCLQAVIVTYNTIMQCG